MAKLFVAVIPESSCEKDLKRLIKAFTGNRYHWETKELPLERDANYYMFSCVSNPELVELLCENLNNGYYSKYGWLVMKDPILQSVYGFYRASVEPDDCTLDDFINGKEG